MTNTTLSEPTAPTLETAALRSAASAQSEPKSEPKSERKAAQDFLFDLYRRYYALVHRICFRYTKNRDEAEDLAQEVFLKVHGNYSSFEGHAQPSTWLYRVTVNHCLDYLRWRKRQGELMSAFADELSERPCREAAPDHPAKLLFRRLLEELDEGNRQVVMLRFEVGLTHEEIAEICGVSRVAITKRLAKFQARVQSLRSQLGMYMESAGSVAESAGSRHSVSIGEE